MNHLSRKEKIEKLKALQQGKVSVNDLMPVTVEVWLRDDNAMYHEHKQGLCLTKTEFEAHKEANKCKPGKKIMFVPDERFEESLWNN